MHGVVLFTPAFSSFSHTLYACGPQGPSGLRPSLVSFPVLCVAGQLSSDSTLCAETWTSSVCTVLQPCAVDSVCSNTTLNASLLVHLHRIIQCRCQGHFHYPQRAPALTRKLVHRLALLWMFGFAFRMKFYFVWALSEANLTLAGFGFNGWRDESHTEAKFDRHTNGRPLQIEFASSTATLMLHWNCRTSDFLRRCTHSHPAVCWSHAALACAKMKELKWCVIHT